MTSTFSININEVPDEIRWAYLRLDGEMRVLKVSDNLPEYGFSGVQVGSNIADHMDFLHGVDSDQALELPILLSPNNKPISVHLIPKIGEIDVLIMNAASEFEMRQLLQQKVNEVELLLDDQKKLYMKLDVLKQQIESSNIELKEASRLQSSFLSGLSHEFRTPLASVIGYSNLLEVDADQQKFIDAIQRSSKYLMSLIENLLDHNKLSSDEVTLNPKYIGLADVFDDVKALLQPILNRKQIDFEVEYDFPANLFVYVDDIRLRQCIVNIVSNAIKFTDAGTVSVIGKWHDDELEVTVIDSGIGIKEENVDKVFLPFWQVGSPGMIGTGLGLTITKKMVDLMGGTLLLESEYGLGTLAKMILPSPEIDAAPDQTQEDIVWIKSSKLKVLLVEDDQDIADLLITQLSENGWVIDHVVNGKLAVQSAQLCQYDIILMDVRMPVMDGFESAKEIRSNNINTPIIILSASAIMGEDDRLKAVKAGCDGYLEKPVKLDDLFVLVKELVTRGQ